MNAFMLVSLAVIAGAFVFIFFYNLLSETGFLQRMHERKKAVRADAVPLVKRIAKEKELPKNAKHPGHIA